jgi:hypothetical protein
LKRHFVFLVLLSLLAVSAHAATIDLGTAANFGVLGGSGVTCADAATVINGDVGSAPTPAVTGITPVMVNGILYLAADDATAKAHLDLIAAYDAAAAATPTGTLAGAELGSLTLGPGVYSFSSLGLTGNLTLDGGSDPDPRWIFQSGSTLITAADATVSFINGGPSDVFWQVGSSATLGANNAFAGNIMAYANIALGGGTLNGRALAITEAVTIGSAETVNAVPEPSGIMALGMMLIPAAALLRKKK